MPPSKVKVEIDMEDTKAIIRHVLKTITDKCYEEAEHDCSDIPFSNIQARIKYYTGLSNSLVEKLMYDTPHGSQLNLESRILILNTVKGLYVQHRLPTFNTIFEETKDKLKDKDDQPITGISEFMKEMKILGFILKETVNNTTIVMEDPEVRFERFMYLHKLIKFRSNTAQWPQIVYVDERIVDLAQKFEKPAYTQPGSVIKLSENLDESVFYHAVSNTGFITGMFSNQDDFSKWVKDILLVHLKTPSVIIMDSLRGPPENGSCITRYHSKTDMIRWLTNNNIPCSNNMSKPALYELIALCNENRKDHHIDFALKSQGHEVLRLPRHLSDLSITTSLWNSFEEKGEIEVMNSLMDLQSSLLKKLNAIPAATWTEYEKDIEKMEKEIFNIDTTLENFCDMYEINM